MHVGQSTRQAAVLRLYKTECRDVGAMYIDDLQDQWETTGLRQTDCEVAIKEMLKANVINTSSSASGVLAFLTAEGLKELDQSTVPPVQRIIDWVTLQRVQWRRTRSSSTKRRVRRRRSDDISGSPEAP